MKARYMIVEDEHWELKGLEARVRRLLPEFELLGTATNGFDGLLKARELKPDVVLTDIRMPQMDGLTFAQKLLSLTPNCAVVILSGFSEFEYAKRAIAMGVTGYLLKPVDDEELKTELLRAASDGRLMRTARPPVEEAPAQSDRLLFEIREYVLRHYAEEITVKSIAERFSMDISNLSRQYKRLFDINLSEHIAATRLDAARRLLIGSELNSAQIGAQTGFSDSSYFYRAFKRAYGLPPGEYRDAHKKRNGD